MASEDKTIQEKVKNVISHSLWSDAATLGNHWQYDSEKLKASQQEGNEILFATHLLNPFYRVPEGASNTFYGDQAIALLQALEKYQSLSLDKQTPKELALLYARELENTFGNGSAGYGQFPEENVSRDQYPVLNRGWRSHSLKAFLSSVLEKKASLHSESDPEQIYLKSACADEQSDCLAKVAPIVGFVLKSKESLSDLAVLESEVFEYLEPVIQVTQLGPNALPSSLAAARILIRLLVQSPAPSFEQLLHDVAAELAKQDRVGAHHLDHSVIETIQKVLAHKDTPHVAFVAENGKGCGLFFNFGNALHAVLTHQTLEEALTQTVLAGGDSAGRGVYIGAVFGALAQAPPKDWPAKFESWGKIHAHL